MTDELAKKILDAYATIVVEKEAIFVRDGASQVNQKKQRHYPNGGYSPNIILWIAPLDCLRIEFEDTREQNDKFIVQLEAACKAKGYDYCITDHGGTSAYMNLFNIKGMPVNEDNKLARIMLAETLLPSGAKRQLDKTNLGWTLSPVIGHPHWKPKYGGKLHKIVTGKNPLEHNNAYPKGLLKKLEKVKAQAKKNTTTTKKLNKWVDDFLLNYCCENLLPAGERHFVIEKNLAAYIIHRQDKEQIEERYLKAQKRKTNTLRTWYSAILNGQYTDVSAGELYNYIKDKDLNYVVERQEEQSRINVNVSRFDVRNIQDNVIYFHTQQPFFYDKIGIFWFWNLDDCKYEIVDSVDVMMMLDALLKFRGITVNNKLKLEYLEAFKRIGRFNIPAEPNKSLIQFKDKVYDMNDGSIKNASPKMFFTNPIPWNVGEGTETPILDSLFEQWVGKAYVKTLYEFMGYCCYRGYPIQTLFCLWGSGRNGKSQFLKILEKFIGKDNTTTSELDAITENRFESFKLYKKLCCTIGETNFNILNKTNLLKKLTGGDKISYEAKNKMPFDDYSYCKLIIASNSLPSTEDTSDGFYRRWLIIDFPNEFEESGREVWETVTDTEYRNLAKKITLLLPELLNKGKFTKQGTIEERKKRFTEVSNPLMLFIETHCTRREQDYIMINKLYAAYSNYLTRNKKRIVKYREFKSCLEAEGIYSYKTNKVNKITGEYVNALWLMNIDLKEMPQDSDNDKKVLTNDILKSLISDEVMDIDSLIAYCCENYVCNEKQVESYLSHLKNVGYIFEPRLGEIKKNE